MAAIDRAEAQSATIGVVADEAVYRGPSLMVAATAAAAVERWQPDISAQMIVDLHHWR